jgi:hypothetical protein
MAKEQKLPIDCRNRQPEEGEEIHTDLRDDPMAEKVWAQVDDKLVEAMAELVSRDCPKNLRETKYFNLLLAVHSSPSYIEAKTRVKQRMALEVMRTGYELTGWPVVYRNEDGSLKLMNGTHRLALYKALGKPVRAIVQEQKG